MTLPYPYTPYQSPTDPNSDAYKQQFAQFNALRDAAYARMLANTRLTSTETANTLLQNPDAQAAMTPPASQNWGDNDLLGAAKFWGIPDQVVQTVSRDQLVAMVNDLRTREQPQDTLAQRMIGGLAEAANFGPAVGIGLLDTIRSIPVIGPAFGRIKVAQDADVWLHSLEEGTQQTGFVEGRGDNLVTTGLVGRMAGMWYPGLAAWQLATKVGALVPIVRTAGPIVRGAFNGAGSTWLLSAGGPDWESGKTGAGTVAMGAGLGAAGGMLESVLQKLVKPVADRAEQAFIPQPRLTAGVQNEPLMLGPGGGELPPASGGGPGLPAGQYDMPSGAPLGLPPSWLEPTSVGTSPYLDVSDVAAGMNKAGQVIESPNLPSIAKSAAPITDVTAAESALASNPGGSNIVQGIGDPVQFIQSFTQPNADKVFVRFATRTGSTRLDALMSDIPLGDAQIAQYETHGVYEGQAVVTRNGKLGKVQSIVEGPYADSPAVATVMPENGRIPFRVGVRNLQPRVTSTGSLESEELWSAFSSYADRQAEMAAQNAEQIATIRQQNLPHYLESFFQQVGIIEPAAQSRVTQYFNTRYVDEFKMMAPMETLEAEAVAAAAEEAPHIASPLGLLDAHASTKGFTVVPQGTTLVLEDAAGKSAPMQFDSLAEAHEFLTQFDRSVPEVAPPLGVPGEVMSTAPTIVDQPLNTIAQTEARMADAIAELATAPDGTVDGPTRVIAEQVRQMAGTTRLAQMQMEFRKAIGRWSPMRIAMQNLDNVLYKYGIEFSPLNKVYRPVSEGITEYENVRTPWDRQVTDVLQDIRQKHQVSGLWSQIYMIEDETARLAAATKAGFNPAEIQAMTKMEDFWHSIFQETGLDPMRELRRYMPMLQRAQSTGDFSALGQWKKTVDPLTDTFFEHVRKGTVNARELNPQVLADTYIHAFAWGKTLAGPYEAAANSVNELAKHVPELAPATEQLQEWLNLVRHGYKADNDIARDAMQLVLQTLLGPNVSKNQATRAIGGMMSSTYSALLGYNPAPIIRDSQQMFLAMPFTGKKLLEVQARFLTASMAEKAALWERALADNIISPIHHRATSLAADVGLEAAAYDAGSMALGAPTRRQQMLGELSGWMEDVMPKWMKSEKLRPMYFYGKQGELSRMIVGTAMREQTEQALMAYREAGAMGDIEQLLGESKVRMLDPAAQREFQRMVALGQDTEAAAYAGRQVADVSQFKYGPAEGVAAMRSTTGKFLFQLGTYPVYLLHYLGEVARNGATQDKVRALATMGTLFGAYSLATKATGWNFNRLNPFAGTLPGIGPSATLVGEASQSLRESWDTMTGQRDTGSSTAATLGTVAAQTANLFNPARGLIRGVQGMDNAMQSIDPAAAMTRLMVTGERDNRVDFNNASTYVPPAVPHWTQQIQLAPTPIRLNQYSLPQVPAETPVYPSAVPQMMPAGGDGQILSRIAPSGAANGVTGAPNGSQVPPAPFPMDGGGGGASY